MRKFLAALLTVLMLSTMCTAFAQEHDLLIAPNPNAVPAPITVQVEGIDGNLYSGSAELNEGDTVLSVLEEVLTGAGIPYEKADGPYGAYITSVAGETAGKFGGYDGWSYYVDGQSPGVSMSAYELKGGEEVLLAYGDMNALLPILTASRDGEGLVTLTVTADVTTYDENWNASVFREPVAGARLTVDGGEYITDEKGQAVLSAESSAKSQAAVQIEKKSEAGAPLVIRLAPDYTLDLAAVAAGGSSSETVWIGFPDVPQDAWYAPYVLELAQKAVVTGFEDGTFQPDDPVTRAQAANILHKLAGQPAPQGDAVFSDVAADSWYAGAVRWAYAQGIVTGADGKFRPDAPITRQDLAVMLVRYQTNVVKAELAQEAGAPAFADNDQIASYAAEAVYTLQKAGIIGGSEGRFLPLNTATRAELCKMLSGLAVAD